MIGNAAIAKGARVLYSRLDDFIFSYKTKNRFWNKILESDLLILDDFFYTKPTEEELLLINKNLMFLNETRSIVIITNRQLSLWKEMDVDKHLVETFQKRMLNDAQIITLKVTE